MVGMARLRRPRPLSGATLGINKIDGSAYSARFTGGDAAARRRYLRLFIST